MAETKDKLSYSAKANLTAQWTFNFLLTVALFGAIVYMNQRINQSEDSLKAVNRQTEQLRMDVIKAEVKTDYLEVTVGKLPPESLIKKVDELKDQIDSNHAAISLVRESVIRIESKIDRNGKNH